MITNREPCASRGARTVREGVGTAGLPHTGTGTLLLDTGGNYTIHLIGSDRIHFFVIGFTGANSYQIGRFVTYGTFPITAMKLELGSVQTLAHQENGAWVLNEIPDFGEELLKCQRYYYQSYNGDMSIDGVLTREAITANRLANVELPVSMRTTPNITIYNPNTKDKNTLCDWSSDGQIDDASVVYANNKSFVPSAQGLTSGNYYYFHFTAVADL